MCEYKVKAAHPLNASHDVDEQRLLTRRFGVFAELLPEGYLRHQGAEDASSESSGLALEPEGPEAELDDMIKTWPGVDSIRADALHRNWDDLVAADEVLGQPVTRMAGHRCLGEESGDLIIDSVLLVFRIRGFVFAFSGRLLLRLQFCKGREGLAFKGREAIWRALLLFAHRPALP